MTILTKYLYSSFELGVATRASARVLAPVVDPAPNNWHRARREVRSLRCPAERGAPGRGTAEAAAASLSSANRCSSLVLKHQVRSTQLTWPIALLARLPSAAFAAGLLLGASFSGALSGKILASADAPSPWQCGFQDPATPVMEGIIDLHHDICFFLAIVLVFVMWLLGRTAMSFDAGVTPTPRKIVHGTALEIFWTLAPSAVLVLIAVPSFALLYGLDEVAAPAATVKAVGHQWYWSYEYSDRAHKVDELIFDSYMVPEDQLAPGELRLLEVDQRLVLPTRTPVRLLISAADVLHAFAVPALGIKIDAVPGRLNQVCVFLKREGLFYGQCSEICGANHAFMPIVIESVGVSEYAEWLQTKAAE